MKRYASPEICPELPDLLSLAEDLVASHDYERALDVYGRALERLAEVPADPGVLQQRAALRNARAELFVQVGQWQRGLEDLDRVLARAPDLEDPGLEVQARVLSARISSFYGEYSEAIHNLELAMDLAERGGGPRERALVHLELGTLYARIGEPRLGEESLAEVGRLLPEPDEDPDLAVLRASALTQRGLAAFRERRSEEARACYDRSLEILARWAPGSRSEAEASRYLGVLCAVEGNAAEALRHHRRALELYRRLKLPLGQAKVYNSIGQTCLDVARLDEALHFMRKAEDLCRDLGADADLATIYGKLGSIYLQRQEYDRAVELHRQDVELCRRFGNYRALAFAIRNLGLSHQARGDHEEAVARLKEALQRFEELQDRIHTLRLHLDLAQAWLDRGRLPEAEASHARASGLLTPQDPGPDRARAEQLLGTLHRLRQRRGEAEAAYHRAREILEGLEPSGALARVHYDLGALLEEAREPERALGHLRECLRMARQLGLPRLREEAVRLVERIDEVDLVSLLIEEVEGASS